MCDALTFGPTPPQLPNPPLDAMFPTPAIAGEGCLNLNIWSPAPRSSGLPVMVWIPGGAFESGTGAAYDGIRQYRLAEQNVVDGRDHNHHDPKTLPR